MRILLVQTSFLGDTILSTPVIHAIKSAYPQSELWMMTTPLSAELVIRDPLLAGVIPFDKRGEASGVSGLMKVARQLKQMGFDRAYSLHRSYRTAVLLWLAGIPLRIGCADAKLGFLYHEVRPRNLNDHDVIRNLSILSPEELPDPQSAQMRLFPPKAGAATAAVQAQLTSCRPYAILAPGSVWRTKQWQWQGFRAVAEYLLSRHINVVLLGSADDKQVCAKVADNLDVLDLSGMTSIADAVFMVAHADLMVCNDSMSQHMASALKVPNVVIFCATSPAFGYGPWKNRAIVKEVKDLDCKPCRTHGSKTCPNATEACMRELSAQEVIAAVAELLDT